MNEMSKKKPYYKVNEKLHEYLLQYGRETSIPVTYDDLMRSTNGFPLFDNTGIDTLWETKVYEPDMWKELNHGLTMIYALLKTDGDMSVMEHLYTDRIDFCTFGNSKPFRIRIVNQFNDNYDYFYLKIADASRVYGLELEHILSPNRINYIVDGESLVEEHIAGIPGDQFIKTYMDRPNFNRVRLAKEFVKFNERCFVRLLGDMRSYNYVMDVTPDFEEEQYRIRAIDFDQQCYEGRKTLYLPQYFKENNAIVNLGIELMTPETVKQYQQEERTLMAKRLISARHRMKDLIDCLLKDEISTPEKTAQLRDELGRHFKSKEFEKCESMGELLRTHLKVALR
jgi:hypothetical protein